MTAPANAHGPQQQTADAASSAMLYFAYGSMCNPVSLSRRGLFPTASHPARLSGYQLVFELGGMANIVAQPGSSCHGVLHRVTPQEFEVLHEIEASYETVQLPVVPYTPHSHNNSNSASNTSTRSTPAAASAPAAAPSDDNADNAAAAALALGGAPVTATAFIVPPPKLAAMAAQHPEWGASLPSDRYIRIITAGLRHFGADAGWVEWVAAQPCKPGRQPAEYLKVPLPSIQPQQQQQDERSAANGSDGSSSADKSQLAGLRVFSMQELQQHEGVLHEHKAVFALGCKVVEVDVSAKPDSPFVATIVKHFAGKQAVFTTCMMLQEPRLPPLSSPADVRPEHVAWAEDLLVESMRLGNKFGLRQVGWLEGEGVQGGVGGADAAAAALRDAAEALHEEDEASTAPETGVLL